MDPTEWIIRMTTLAENRRVQLVVCGLAAIVLGAIAYDFACAYSRATDGYHRLQNKLWEARPKAARNAKGPNCRHCTDDAACDDCAAAYAGMLGPVVSLDGDACPRCAGSAAAPRPGSASTSEAP